MRPRRLLSTSPARPGTLLLLATACLGPASCGHAGGSRGAADGPSTGRAAPQATVRAFIRDGPRTTIGAAADDAHPASLSITPATSSGRAASGGDPAASTTALPPDGSTGRFHANIIVSLYSDDGYWVDVGRHGQMEVALPSRTPAPLVESVGDIPAGSYSRVRLLICHSAADLSAGARVAGRTLDRPESIFLTETGDVVIERNVRPVSVEPGGELRVDVDLESPEWLTREAVATDTASVPLFEQKVAVSLTGQPE